MWIEILAAFLGGVVGGLVARAFPFPRRRRAHRLSDPSTIIAVDRRIPVRRGRWE